MISYINYTQSPIACTGDIKIFDETAFTAMKAVCSLTSDCLDLLTDIVKPGITTKEIDDFVFNYALKHNVLPATLNYRGYKYSSCTSVNHVVCHGMPSPKKLNEGDIINIDVTFIQHGWHGDSSRMYPVGKVKPLAKNLMRTTYECLMKSIEVIKPGSTTNDIGAVIEAHAHYNRFSVVKDFCGHGVGQLFHDAPNILHYKAENNNIKLKSGMIFTIEPMINVGKADVKILSDGWTAVTKDKSLSAQYEHTIGITNTGCEIFTLSSKNLFYTE